jgi:glycine cleavage system H protein
MRRRKTMEREKSRERCPFLKEERVVFCRAYPLKKALPFDRISEEENICFKTEHLTCFTYSENAIGVPSGSRMCPFLGIETVIYCQFFPIKKMIPVSALKLTSPCSSENHRECSLYRKMVNGERKVMNVQGFFLDDGAYYFESHAWARPLSEGVQIGLDDFGQYILGDIEKIELPRLGDEVRTDKPFLGLRCGDMEVALQPPVDGIVARVNEVVRRDSSFINTDPYGDGWLIEVRTKGQPDRLLRNRKDAFSGGEAKKWLEKEIVELRYVMESEIGVTMTDGGEISRDFRNSIGDKGRALIKHFFTTKEG